MSCQWYFFLDLRDYDGQTESMSLFLVMAVSTRASTTPHVLVKSMSTQLASGAMAPQSAGAPAGR